MLLGLSSWVVGLVFSIPLSFALETTCGRIFLQAPLDFHLSPSAALAWLAVVLVLSLLCSLDPARRATRLPVREALAVA